MDPTPSTIQVMLLSEILKSTCLFQTRAHTVKTEGGVDDKLQQETKDIIIQRHYLRILEALAFTSERLTDWRLIIFRFFCFTAVTIVL